MRNNRPIWWEYIVYVTWANFDLYAVIRNEIKDVQKPDDHISIILLIVKAS